MSSNHTTLDALHEATHRLPGVPEHQDHPAGHQGATRHGRWSLRPFQNRPFQNRPVQSPQPRTRGVGSHQGSAPANDRRPRVLVGWQNWIVSLFSRTSQ